MTKALLPFFAACTIATAAFGQVEFHWGVGLGVVQVATYTPKNNVPPLLSENYWSAAFTVAPRLNLAELSESASFAVGTDPSFLYWRKNEGSRGIEENRVGFDIPVYVMFNVGRASSYYATEQLGLFIGAGFDYTSVTLSGEGYEDKYNASGPMIIGGLKFQAGKRTLGATVSKTFGSGAGSLDGLGVRAMWYFGDY